MVNIIGPLSRSDLNFGVAITLFMTMDDKATRVGIITLCMHAEGAARAAQRQMRNHSLAKCKSIELIAISATVAVEEMWPHSGPSMFLMTGEVLFTTGSL